MQRSYLCAYKVLNLPVIWSLWDQISLELPWEDHVSAVASSFWLPIILFPTFWDSKGKFERCEQRRGLHNSLSSAWRYYMVFCDHINYPIRQTMRLAHGNWVVSSFISFALHAVMY